MLKRIIGAVLAVATLAIAVPAQAATTEARTLDTKFIVSAGVGHVYLGYTAGPNKATKTATPGEIGVIDPTSITFKAKAGYAVNRVEVQELETPGTTVATRAAESLATEPVWSTVAAVGGSVSTANDVKSGVTVVLPKTSADRLYGDRGAYGERSDRDDVSLRVRVWDGTGQVKTATAVTSAQAIVLP